MNEPPHTPPLGSVILHLRPLPGSWAATPERRLARLLKYALRTAGFRATRIVPAPPPPAVTPAAETKGKVNNNQPFITIPSN